MSQTGITQDRAPKRRETELGPEKRCTKCDEWWPADKEFFFTQRHSSDGLFYCCIACYYEHLDKRRRKPASEARPA